MYGSMLSPFCLAGSSRLGEIPAAALQAEQQQCSSERLHSCLSQLPVSRSGPLTGELPDRQPACSPAGPPGSAERVPPEDRHGSLVAGIGGGGSPGPCR